MTWKLVPPVFAAAVILSGCGDVGSTSGGRPGDGTGGEGGQSSGTNSGGEGAGRGSGGAGEGGGVGQGGGGEGGNSSVDECGGMSGRGCADDAYCDFGPDNCGAGDATGRCRPRPAVCPDTYTPTCSCDGTVYDNGCYANKGGTDTANIGGCTAPDGYFGCGAIFCQSGVEYCQKTLSDVVGTPDGYSCVAVPSTCSAGAVDCACLAAQPCGQSCTRLPDTGDLLVTCPGG